MNSEQKESSGGLVMFFVIVAIVLGVLLVGVNGCGTFYGLASDIEEGSGDIRRGLGPEMEKRRQTRLDRAAKLVIAEKGDRNTNQ